jgi:predicted CXXCH cytochrome family protein
MSQANPRKTRAKSRARIFACLWILLAAGGSGVLLVGSGFAFAATQEQRDSFCTSCHTQPESTYYQRSTDTQPVDLASAHKSQPTRCIDCHSGSGVAGRVQAEMLGAHNALLFVTGTAVQPARLTRPIGDENCLKCHQTVTSGRGRDNHFHAFLSRWQAVDPKAGTCVSCHSGHATDGNADNRFLNEARTETVCQACHVGLRREDD